MLVNDMKEKQTRHIDLIDVDPEVFKVQFSLKTL